MTFTESGLPASTSWSTTFGGDFSSSVTATIVFNVVSGTYAYTIKLVGYIASPASGRITVDGAATGQAVGFTAGAVGTYTVTFTESGLTAGTSWSVTFNALLESSVTSTIAFASVAGGTYTFTSGVVANFTANPATGSVVVNGAAAGQTVTFNAAGATGGGGSSSGGGWTPFWVWFVIGLVAVGCVAGIGASLAYQGRPKPKGPAQPAR